MRKSGSVMRERETLWPLPVVKFFSSRSSGMKTVSPLVLNSQERRVSVPGIRPVMMPVVVRQRSS